MNNTYYYFASTLPTLSWEGKLPMSSEDFLQDCERLLSEQDFIIMHELLKEDTAALKMNNAVINSWIKFERDFRNELVKFRAHRMHKDAHDYIRGDSFGDPLIAEMIDEVSKSKNLLEAEKTLDYIKWQFLDDIVLGHYYDIESLVVYGLKLKILERHQEFYSSRGKEIFEEYKEVGVSSLNRK